MAHFNRSLFVFCAEIIIIVKHETIIDSWSNAFRKVTIDDKKISFKITSWNWITFGPKEKKNTNNNQNKSEQKLILFCVISKYYTMNVDIFRSISYKLHTGLSSIYSLTKYWIWSKNKQLQSHMHLLFDFECFFFVLDIWYRIWQYKFELWLWKVCVCLFNGMMYDAWCTIPYRWRTDWLAAHW